MVLILTDISLPPVLVQVPHALYLANFFIFEAYISLMKGSIIDTIDYVSIYGSIYWFCKKDV